MLFFSHGLRKRMFVQLSVQLIGKKKEMQNIEYKAKAIQNYKQQRNEIRQLRNPRPRTESFMLIFVLLRIIE